jgi:hypothetical protein
MIAIWSTFGLQAMKLNFDAGHSLSWDLGVNKCLRVFLMSDDMCIQILIHYGMTGLTIKPAKGLNSCCICVLLVFQG